MNAKAICFAVAALTCAMSSAAAETRVGAWRLSLGPAWRANVRSSVSGVARVTPVAASHTVSYDRDVSARPSWNAADLSSGAIAVVPDNDPLAPPGSTLYAATATRIETTVAPNGDSCALSSSDWRSPLGVKADVGFDAFDFGPFAVGLDAVFAAYWGMKSSAAGFAGGGTRSVETSSDYWLFESGPYPPGTDFSYCYPSADPYVPYRTATGGSAAAIPATAVGARISSDLYQLGIGPSVSWRAFDWLDAYARVVALCNIAHMEVDANWSSGTSTACMFGAGGEVGAVAWLCGGVGVYAEVGYEWIDEATARLGPVEASADFSSLVVSAGVAFGF